MKINNKWLSIIFKLLIVVVGLTGIIIQCGLFTNKINLGVLNYYTLMSNILVVVYFAGAVISSIRNQDTFLPQFKGALVMCITVTGLIFHFMLSGTFKMSGTIMLSNICLHYLTPIMTILDWILFDTKGVYKKYSPLLWIIIPYMYVAYTYICAAISNNHFDGNKYPYQFFNIDQNGLPKTLITIVVLTIIFIILGYIIYFVDKKLSKKKDK